MEPTSSVFYIAGMTPEPGYEDQFNDWYDTEHLPELLACDGYRDARRFRLLEGLPGSPTYLSTYHVRDMAVFESEAYLKLLHRTPEQRTELAREVAAHRSMELYAKYQQITYLANRHTT